MSRSSGTSPFPPFGSVDRFHNVDPIFLAAVAVDAGCAEVGWVVYAVLAVWPFGSRDDVVDGVGSTPAVSAAVVVSLEYD